MPTIYDSNSMLSSPLGAGRRLDSGRPDVSVCNVCGCCAAGDKQLEVGAGVNESFQYVSELYHRLVHRCVEPALHTGRCP